VVWKLVRGDDPEADILRQRRSIPPAVGVEGERDRHLGVEGCPTPLLPR
jgi:hypothetical protein